MRQDSQGYYGFTRWFVWRMRCGLGWSRVSFTSFNYYLSKSKVTISFSAGLTITTCSFLFNLSITLWK
jgi:hypothetical protein